MELPGIRFSCGTTSDHDNAKKPMSSLNSNNQTLSSPPNNQLQEKVVSPVPEMVSMTLVRRRQRGNDGYLEL
jgi:hypothetical protein